MRDRLRWLGLVAVCLAVSNCAGSPSVVGGLKPDTLAADDAFWSTQDTPPARRAPVRRLAAPATTGGIDFTGSNASIGQPRERSSTASDPFTPEWYATEKAEADRLKRSTNICRC